MTFIHKTWIQLRRSPFQGLAAVMTTTLTLLVIAIFALISLGSIQILQYFESAPQVIAFFTPGEDLTDTQISNIRAQLAATGKLNQLNDLAGLKAILQTQEGVEDVVFYEDIIQSLQNWISSVEKLGAIAIAYLTLESILVILVIIGLQISSRREEIEILKLLGATNWFIKKPFIVNGLMYGLVGSFLAWSVSYILLLYATPFLANWLGDIPLLPVPFLVMLSLLGGELLLGGLIGTIGGLTASNRFLKEVD